MFLTIACCIALFRDPMDAGEYDLRTIAIPKHAVERPRRIRPMGRVNAAVEYFVDYVRVARREIYDNGKVAEENLYRGGKLHGISRQYYWSGKLYAERPYRDGVMDGEFRFWDEQGTLMGSSLIQRGTGLLREFAQDHTSSTDAETPYRNGQMNGHAKKWGHFLHCRGIGFESSNYVDGKPDALGCVRHDDGLLLRWWYYRNGKLHGPITQIERDGRVAERYPKYYLQGKEVSESELGDAADKDPELAKTLKYRPAMHEKIPESPSQAFARKQAAEKAKSAEKPN
jgi:antitoxin component YwqK of YwqJK toxin-antitoxin module